MLTRDDVAAFAGLGAEIACTSPLGTFWLVPARTGQDRLEFTPEEAAVLLNLVQVFGGQVIAVIRPTRAAAAPRVEPDAAASARAHLEALRALSAPARPAVQPGLFDRPRGAK